MHNRLTIILILFFSLLILPAHAITMTGDGYQTESIDGLGGGGSKSGGGYNLQDSMGAPVVGESTDGSTTINMGGLQILAGEITPEVTEVPAGTAPLTISRNGNHIKLEWDANIYGVIDIYYLSGDGTGQYSDDTGWQMLQALDGDGEYEDVDQVGLGDGERYYKALLAGEDPAAAHPDGDTYIAQAWAVGKMNVNITGDQSWTLISVPFINVPQDLNDLIGDQGAYAMGDEVSTSVLTFGFEGGGFNRGSYYNGSEWVAIPGLNEALYDGEKGLYIKTKSGDTDKMITLVGDVKSLDTATAYAISTNWNLLSFPYPKQMALGAIGLDVGTKNDDMDNADLVFGFSGGGFNIGSYLSASGVWNPIPGLTGVDLMNATDSVYYYSLTQGDVNWSLTPSLQGY